MADQNATLMMGEKRILQYNHAIAEVPDGVDQKYRRGAFIHPLWSPDGEPLTRIQPSDHYHHYGIWNPWTKTTFKGKTIDFWNLIHGQGTVLFKEYSQIFEGPVAGGLTVDKQHVVLEENQKMDPAINESLDIKAWQTNESNSQFLIDYVVNLECASNEKIILNNYRYGGGIGFRATERWTNMNSEVLTSEGKTRKDADASKAKWCIVYGESDSPSKQSGILFLSHPENQSHPEPMRVWPINSNNNRGDVFFEFCPIRHTEWPLYPGNQYRLKYRLVVFDGSLDAEKAEQLWNDFANPPHVQFN
jgi:hypothetical protein